MSVFLLLTITGRTEREEEFRNLEANGILLLNCTCKFEFATTDCGYKKNRGEKGSLEHGVEEMSMKYVFLYSGYIASRSKKKRCCEAK